MGEPKFTKGPWHFEQPWSGFSALRGPSGELIFGIAAGRPDEKQTDEVCEANAHLIAAAPDLFEALTNLTEAYTNAARLLGANILALSEDGALKQASAALLKASPGGTKDAR